MTSSNKPSHHCNEEHQHHQNHHHCPYSGPLFIINPNAYTIMNIPHCSTPNSVHAFEVNTEPLPIPPGIYGACMSHCSNTLGSFAEKIKVHADTIRLVPDNKNPGSQKLSFTFDALEPGSFTIFYVAKEEANFTFKPVGSVIQEPKIYQFQKGLAQKFDQPEGGINLSVFKSVETFKHGGGVYPLVISAEISLSSSCSVPLPIATSHGQITQAVLEENTEGHFQVKVMNQKSWWHKISTNNEPRDDMADTDVPLKKRKISKPAGDEACNAGFRTKRINSNLKGANFIFNNLGPTNIVKYMNIGPGAGGRNEGKKAGSINDNRGCVSFTL
ncbi:hypothetical protein SLE2022_082740 [Rubroshorea leprosula]